MTTGLNLIAAKIVNTHKYVSTSNKVNYVSYICIPHDRLLDSTFASN